MEQSSCSLYSGPLSQAALKILAVLQAQRNTNNHRQMERFNDSQREPWVQASRDMNQQERKERGTDRPQSRPMVSSFLTSPHDSFSETQIPQTPADYQRSQTPESSLSSQATSCSSSRWVSSLQREPSQTEPSYQCSQAYSHRKHPKPPSYQSSQAPSPIQCEDPERASLFSHRDRYNLSLQIPMRPPGHQWRNNTDEIRPSFILSLSPDDRGPDEVLFPTVESPHTHKEEPVLAYQSVSSCHSTSYDTDNSTSAPLKDTKSWNVLRNQLEGVVAADTRLKGEIVLTDSIEEASSGGEDGGILYLQSEAETIKAGRTLGGYVTRREGSCNSNSPILMRPVTVEEDVEQTVDVSEGEHEIHNRAKHVEHLLVIESKETPVGCYTGSTENPEGALVQCEPTADDPVGAAEERLDEAMKSGFAVESESRTNSDAHTETECEMEAEQSYFDVQIKFESQRRDTNPEEKGTNRDESVMLQDEKTATEGTGRESRPTLTSQECGARGSEVNVSCPQQNDNEQTTDVSISGTSSGTVLAPASTFSTGQNSSTLCSVSSTAQPNRLGNYNPLSTIRTHLHQHRLFLSSPLKRKREALQHQHKALPKICLTRRHPKCIPPCSKQEKSKERAVRIDASIPECPATACLLQEKDKVSVAHTHSDVPQTGFESTRSESKLTRATVTCKLPHHKQANYGPDHDPNQSKSSHEWDKKTETLTSDPRVKASGKLSANEKTQMLEKSKQAKTVVLTMVYQDGATQLDPAQKLPPAVCGLLVLMIWNELECSTAEDFLGPNDSLTKMKQLEQEAHRAAGQIFLVTSNTQLRTVLFEKLRLHERCENKKLPKTINKQQQSTSEAALLQLQDLHALPKIILEYRQIHKIKSTFVDGILSCMMSKNYISSTWYQTSVVTGRISAKHPNFQALPRQPLQITKKQYVQGKEEEVVTVHPRAMFIPQKGCTFLAADFCQVELRLLAHLSSDPELLRIFTNPQADIFTMLASQWKGLSEGEVTSEDREHAKRIVYSVVYGAGRKRLSGILGVCANQASQFQDSFLQTYREVQAFIQSTIQLCHKQGYVLSIMGRRRTLPNIDSPDWGIRMQAERQAVNFTVQGSAADLCKVAMIRIFNLVSTSSLTARLIAQLHDELLYEVEDSQVESFAALVKSTMESLQHMDQQGVHLKVPLKVAVSIGKSWGSMYELKIPSASP